LSSLESDNVDCENNKKRVKWVLAEETDTTKEQNSYSAEALCENETNDETQEIVLKQGEGEI